MTGNLADDGEAIAVIESSAENLRGSRIISRILPPAIRLWLSTQLDHVEALNFRVEGRDRELLSGHIPEINLAAQKAIYQGIHLSQACVTASEIHVNLGQVMRRKPLRLLAPFPVRGEVMLTEADLNRSLRSPLLGEGLYDFLQLLCRAQPEAQHLQAVLADLPERTVAACYDPTAQIEIDHIVLKLIPKEGCSVPAIALSTQLAIRDGHQLCLENARWLPAVDSASDRPAIPLPALQGFTIDLGSEVTLTQCNIHHQRLSLAGTLRVLPTDALDT